MGLRETVVDAEERREKREAKAREVKKTSPTLHRQATQVNKKR